VSGGINGPTPIVTEIGTLDLIIAHVADVLERMASGRAAA
jgi:hypothetical protein